MSDSCYRGAKFKNLGLCVPTPLGVKQGNGGVCGSAMPHQGGVNKEFLTRNVARVFA